MRSFSFFVAIFFAAVGTNAMSMEKTHKNQQKFLRVDTGVQGPTVKKIKLSGTFSFALDAFIADVSVNGEIAGTLTVQSEDTKHQVTLKGLLAASVEGKAAGGVAGELKGKVTGALEITIPVPPDVANGCASAVLGFVVGYICEDYAASGSTLAKAVNNVIGGSQSVKTAVDKLLVDNHCQPYENKYTECKGAGGSIVGVKAAFKTCKSYVDSKTFASGACTSTARAVTDKQVFTYTPNDFLSLEVTKEGNEVEMKLSVRFALENGATDTAGLPPINQPPVGVIKQVFNNIKTLLQNLAEADLSAVTTSFENAYALIAKIESIIAELKGLPAKFRQAATTYTHKFFENLLTKLKPIDTTTDKTQGFDITYKTKGSTWTATFVKGTTETAKCSGKVGPVATASFTGVKYKEETRDYQLSP